VPARSASLLARPREMPRSPQASTAPCWPAIFLLAAAVIALRATNSHGEPATEPSGIPAGPGQVPAPELAG
jgi:hypothetical protein